jgi:hypothetical protein
MLAVRPWTTALTLPIVLLVTATVAAQEKAKLPATGWGSLQGRVTLEGPIPVAASLEPAMKQHDDKQCCLAGKAEEKIDRTWTVDAKTRGVAHVVVFLKVTPKHYFPIHADDRTRKETIVIDQPHCAFLPYVTVLYPTYFDGKEQIATGQNLAIKNSAMVGHNVRVTVDQKVNVPFNVNLPPKQAKEVTFQPQRYAISLNCDFHKWMSAYIYVFDHPYATVTKADGSFEIPRVPTGAEVMVVAWHPAIGWVAGAGGKKTTFDAGKKNTVDFGFKAPPDAVDK